MNSLGVGSGSKAFVKVFLFCLLIICTPIVLTACGGGLGEGVDSTPTPTPIEGVNISGVVAYGDPAPAGTEVFLSVWTSSQADFDGHVERTTTDSNGFFEFLGIQDTWDSLKKFDEAPIAFIWSKIIDDEGKEHDYSTVTQVSESGDYVANVNEVTDLQTKLAIYNATGNAPEDCKQLTGNIYYDCINALYDKVNEDKEFIAKIKDGTKDLYGASWPTDRDAVSDPYTADPLTDPLDALIEETTVTTEVDGTVVVTEDATSNIIASSTMTVVAAGSPPAAPTNLYVAKAWCGKYIISWTPVPGITDYNLYHSMDGPPTVDGNSFAGTSEGGSNFDLLTDELTPGTHYFVLTSVERTGSGSGDRIESGPSNVFTLELTCDAPAQGVADPLPLMRLCPEDYASNTYKTSYLMPTYYGTYIYENSYWRYTAIISESQIKYTKEDLMYGAPDEVDTYSTFGVLLDPKSPHDTDYYLFDTYAHANSYSSTFYDDALYIHALKDGESCFSLGDGYVSTNGLNGVTQFKIELSGGDRLVLGTDGAVHYRDGIYVARSSNQLPVATINGSASGSGTTGEAYTLDGSGTTDAEGDPISLIWAIVSAPSGSSATIADPTAAITSFTPDVEGSYGIRLYAWNGEHSWFSNDLKYITAETIWTPPTYDSIDGTWDVDVVDSSDIEECRGSWTDTLTISTSGSGATITDSDNVRMTGTLSNNVFRMSGSVNDGAGTTTNSATLTFSSSYTSVSGSASWSYDDGFFACSGTSNISGTR